MCATSVVARDRAASRELSQHETEEPARDRRQHALRLAPPLEEGSGPLRPIAISSGVSAPSRLQQGTRRLSSTSFFPCSKCRDTSVDTQVRFNALHVHNRASTNERSERASERDDESERDGGGRAIDKTPNAARPRLIPQAYTHPLVFSLSSPTTHPLDHYPLPPPPRPPPPPPPSVLASSPIIRPRPPFPPPSVLLLPFASLPLIPYERPPPLHPYATHSLRESPRTLEAARCVSLPPFLTARLSLFHFMHFLVAPLLLPPHVVSFSRRVSFSILLYRQNPITFGQSNERACVSTVPHACAAPSFLFPKKKEKGNRDMARRDAEASEGTKDRDSLHPKIVYTCILHTLTHLTGEK